MSVTQIVVSALTQRIEDDLQYFALAGSPNEVCGLIHSHGIIHQYANTFCGDKQRGFDMEVDIRDMDIKAIWHSHPGGLNKPSGDDEQCMKQLFEHGYNFPWIIVTSKEVTSWLHEAHTVFAKIEK